MIVAVDGPAAAGKGTLARRLAAAFGFAYLDTGSLYRAAALRLHRAGGDGGDVAAAVAAARAVTAADLGEPALRGEAIGRLASRIAALPEVRTALLDLQRRFAAEPPGGKAGAVLDGRDIGTVVCPQAAVKLFVTATLDERTRRRSAELRAAGETIDEATVRADLAQRDADDAARATAPLRPAGDAHLLDTTDLDIESAFDAARSIVAAQLGVA